MHHCLPGVFGVSQPAVRLTIGIAVCVYAAAAAAPAHDVYQYKITRVVRVASDGVVFEVRTRCNVDPGQYLHRDSDAVTALKWPGRTLCACNVYAGSS